MQRNTALRLVSTRDLSHQDWLQVRNQGIGSSEAAAAVGLSPYTSPLALWQHKTARLPPLDLSDNEAVFWGTTLEPIVAQVYQERTGRKVRRVNAVLQHPEHHFMLANLDRAVGAEGILEIKTAGQRSAAQWEDTVPEAYQCQVLHQLAVTGKAWADVAVLIAGQEFRIYRIEPDPVRMADLIEREATFWQHVQNDTPPPVDGTASSARALAAMYPQDRGHSIDWSESAELNTAFEALIELKRQRQELQQQEDLQQQTIQAAMGDASGAVFSNGRISWKRARDSRSVDHKRLILEHPQLAVQYASTTPGVRRFLLQTNKTAAVAD